MTRVEWRADTSRRLSWMALSVRLSRAEVASSNRKIAGFLSRVRAIDTRCFSPPDSFKPRSPTMVW